MPLFNSWHQNFKKVLSSLSFDQPGKKLFTQNNTETMPSTEVVYASGQ
jgi:hypothetical protein